MRIAPQMRWPFTMATILVVVGLADALVVMFVPHPLPWAVLIPSLIPLLTAIFVNIPLISSTKK